jgi:hypothetical protein
MCITFRVLMPGPGPTSLFRVVLPERED